MSDAMPPEAVAIAWAEAAVAGDAAGLRALFAPECRIFDAGDMPFCGWMDLDGFFAQTSVLPLDGAIVFEIGETVAQGERVWFEAQSRARLVGGADYRNVYIFQLQVRGGLIVEYKEFSDTMHIWRTIDDLRTRGPAIMRQPLLTSVTRRLVGNAVAGGSGQVA
ncbi:MAG: nuclear transport factor 2 family protein [Sphingomonadales bacterium]|nr:nuclear transport factor 2 family protein [Sphingomonadales bacterium]